MYQRSNTIECKVVGACVIGGATSGSATSGSVTTGRAAPPLTPARITPQAPIVHTAKAYSFIKKWGSSGIGDGQFDQPWGVAVDSSGNVYVADSANNRVQKFSSDGSFITKWGSTGTGDGQFNSPTGVAVHPFQSETTTTVMCTGIFSIKRLQMGLESLW